MSSNKLIPNAALIYERVDGVVYARYRDPPYNQMERWVIGGDVSQNQLLGYADWQEILRLAEQHPTLKTQLDKLLDIYYILKEEK